MSSTHRLRKRRFRKAVEKNCGHFKVEKGEEDGHLSRSKLFRKVPRRKMIILGARTSLTIGQQLYCLAWSEVKLRYDSCQISPFSRGFVRFEEQRETFVQWGFDWSRSSLGNVLPSRDSSARNSNCSELLTFQLHWRDWVDCKLRVNRSFEYVFIARSFVCAS